MKRLVIVLIVAIAGINYGIRAVDTVQAGVMQRDRVISEVFRK